ncbi:MAG: AAA family ATPase [Polyangiales bacterium]
MIDLALHRTRAALPTTELRARRELGVGVLASLRSLAVRVEALLPDLGALPKISSSPRAATLYVGWGVERAATSGPRFVLALGETALTARWGYGRGGSRGEPRGRYVAEGARLRRAMGEALGDQLSVLRASGAALYVRDDGIPVAEDEWARSPVGSVAFSWHLQGLDEGEVLARRVAESVGRLAAFARSLGAFPEPVPDQVVRDANDLVEAVRAMRWEERAQGVGAPPSGLTPLGRSYVYDPLSGWFAPAGFAAKQPPSLARARLDPDLRAPSLAPHCALAPVERGLHARLARWLSARGARDPTLASTAEVLVAARRAPGADEAPTLEALVTSCLGDASGDVAVAIAALLERAREGDADLFDPSSVASGVPLRLAGSAARGAARLTEHGVLRRGDPDVRRCLSHPALRPTLALAAERALGGLEVLPASAAARRERALARPWELGGITRSATLEAVSQRFARYALAQGVAIKLDLVRSLIVGLRTKPFAVLAGVSGTGKTRVAQCLARFFTEGAAAGARRVAVVPVRPDWLDSRGLLGWLNALEGAWEDTEALRVLLHAQEEPGEPHFIVLDEMNLARVEHYLAEVLSALESGAPIALHGRASAVPTTDGARLVPAEVRVPGNVFFIGTVNVDETTHALSPKVIDRAWTWEFTPLAPSDLARQWLGERRVSPAASADERAALLDGATLDDPVRAMVLAMGRDGVGARVDALYEALAAHGRPFGYRVLAEMLRFIQLCEREGVDAPPSWWLDRAVLGKVLPALGGARRDVEAALRALLPALEGRREAIVRDRTVSDELSPRALDPLPASAEKVREMLERAEARGYVTFSR